MLLRNPNEATPETMEQDRRKGPGTLATYAAKYQDVNARAEGRTKQLVDKIDDILDRVARTIGVRPVFARGSENVKPISDFYDNGYTEVIEVGSVVFRVGVKFSLPGILKLTIALDNPTLGDGGCQINTQTPQVNFEKRVFSIDQLLGWECEPRSKMVFADYSVNQANVQIMNELGARLTHFARANDMALYAQGMVSDTRLTYVLLDQEHD